MNKSYSKPAFIAYLVLMAGIGVYSNSVSVKAAETHTDRDVELAQKVYNFEISDSDFTELKTDILKDDIKYIMNPRTIAKDVELSELVLKDVDYYTFDKQRVSLRLTRFVESHEGKVVFDTFDAHVTIQFKDTIAPELVLSQEKIEIEEGSSFNPEDYVDVLKDNSFAKVNLSIDNPVDVNVAGEYVVTFTASDQSGNFTEQTLTVVVNELEEEVEELVEPVLNVEAPKVVAPVVSSYAVSGDSVTQTLALINNQRALLGVHPLSLGGSQEMSAIALRAQEASSYVSHYRPDGRFYPTAFTDLGIHHSNVLEVLTYSGNSPQDKVNWWMNSPAHRAVLMRSDVNQIVIGIHGKMYAAIVYR